MGLVLFGAVACIGLVLAGSTPARAPVVEGIYGPAIAADNLNNTPVGGPFGQEVSYRFRAATSGELVAVRVYIIDATHPGYGAGTGGSVQITVEPDDGSPAHAPSGIPLASTTVDRPVTGAGNRYAFAPAAKLTAGALYHIVFRNVDAHPVSNYVSLDGLFAYQETAPWQPAYANLDWANLVRVGDGAWSAERGPGQGTTTPILGLEYADGSMSGMGYMEVWYDAEKPISGSRSARESFTVRDAGRRVASVSIRLRRLLGSSPLHVRVETADGGLLVQGDIAAQAITDGEHPTWATLRFTSPVTLGAGRSYHLVLSAPEDTTYGVFVLRKGVDYGYAPSTWFADGSAQYNPGSGWVAFDPGWRGPLDQGDLQFYFQ